MGSCQSANIDGSKQNMRSAIEIKNIQVDDEDRAAQKKRLMKVLLLGSFHTSKNTQFNIVTHHSTGAAESGKSTILKQMKILHDNGFTKEEVAHKRMLVFSNTVRGMGIMLSAMHYFGITLS